MEDIDVISMDIPPQLDMSDLAVGPLSQFGYCAPCSIKTQVCLTAVTSVMSSLLHVLHYV